MVNVAICGGSGYTGSELLRILANHPSVRVKAVTSERSAGLLVTDLFPHLQGIGDLRFEKLDPEQISRKADFIFLALPHAASQDAVAEFYKRGKKIVDLSADFRLKNPSVYSTWYETGHRYEKLLKKAVYGIPEIYRVRIKRAGLVANPGCYPTSALLGLYPVLKKKLVDTSSIVIDSKSGVSGAGRKASIPLSYCEVNESFRAYGISTHRHTPEIEQGICDITGEDVRVDFTPHLLPLNRGILTTIYLKLKEDMNTKDVLSLYKKTYRKEVFVRVYDEGRFPDLRNVRGTNFCDIGLAVNNRTGSLIVVSAIDNLMKGASSQAVQNMNLMLGLAEEEGLTGFSALP